MKTTRVEVSPSDLTPCSVSELVVGREFVICDEFIPEAFPAIYKFRGWRNNGIIIGAIKNLDTEEDALLFIGLNATNIQGYMKRPADVVLVSGRTLHLVKTLRTADVTSPA